MTQKESSIVWFIKQFNAYGTENFKTLFKKEIEQAKEMHKKEIIEAYRFGISDEYVIGSEEYYKETFVAQK
jgi:hypothetical protein